MRRRHNNVLNQHHKQEEDVVENNAQNPLHPSFDVYQARQPHMDGIYPAQSTAGHVVMSPTTYAPSTVGIPTVRQPVPPRIVGPGLAMAGGMVLGMGGSGGHEALFRSSSPPLPTSHKGDLEEGQEAVIRSPTHTARYIWLYNFPAPPLMDSL